MGSFANHPAIAIESGAAKLAARFAGGEQEARLALRELYEEFAPRIFASLQTRRVNHSDAAEIVQETFLKIWATRKKLAADTNIHAYVWCIARNAWIDKYRSERTRNARLATLTDGDHGASDTDDSDSAVVFDCLEKAFEAFRRSEPERAHAIELVAVQGFDQHQLAYALGKSKGAAREYLSQARRAFARLHRELCGEGVA